MGEIMENYITIYMVEELIGYKREISAIFRDIEQMKNDYERSIAPLREDYNRIFNESSELGKRKISIKLNELLDEICWLSETNVEDLEISLRPNIVLDGVYDMADFLDYIGDINKFGVNFRLSGVNDNGYAFNYFTILSMNYDSIQADGRTLLEHCSMSIGSRLGHRKYTQLVIDKDMENIILEFELNLLSMITNSVWGPSDLFTQAVLNCEERKYNKRIDKIRERIK